MDRNKGFFWFVVSACFVVSFSRALTIEPLPKIHVDHLSFEEFDSIYLDQRPVIIRGSTACPSNLDFTNIHQYCQGSIPGNYVKTKYRSNNNSNETNNSHYYWAGLKKGSSEDVVDFNDFVQSMGSSPVNNDLRFMFDVPMVELCPTLPREVRLAPHLVNVFSSHFLHRGDETICSRLPFFNMYLAENSFQTDLHIDNFHSAFVASMCVGSKRWRVMSHQEFAKVYDRIGMGGEKIHDKWVMSSIISPLDTWNNNNGGTTSLESLNVTIYEGILEPGEILYIPAGAPHAATTIGQSLMVASNDRTIESLRESVLFCDAIDDDDNSSKAYQSFASTCQEFQETFPTVMRNYEQQHASQLRPQVETTLSEATGCQAMFDMLAELDGTMFLQITPHTFRQELEKGPLIVLKSQRLSGSCLYLLKHWESWTQGFDPPVRVAILSCFQGQCPETTRNDEDVWYSHLYQQLQGRPTPTILYVSKTNNLATTLRFSLYYGSPMALDHIRVWISYQTGSKILNGLRPVWWNLLLLWILHAGISITVYWVETIGPALFGILVAFGGIAGWMAWEYSWHCASSYWKRQSTKTEKLF